MSDIVERLQSANTWLNEGDCCGQIDASGTCMAPACIFGEALKLSAEAADEIERLRIKCDKQAMILQRLRPEHNPGIYFICGQLGPVDKDGLPEKVMIVPEFGCDWSQIYVKTERQTGPEW